MAESACDWKRAVQEQLISTFGKDPETLTRILFYLDEEEKVYKDCDSDPPVWKTLNQTLPHAEVFQKYAERLAEDTMRAEKDEAFRTIMNMLYTQMMEPSDDTAPDDLGQGFDVVRLVDLSVVEKPAFIGLARAWTLIPKVTQAAIMEVIPKIVTSKHLITCLDEVVGMVNKAGGSIVKVGLAALQLGYDTINNLRRWWKGEITGVRCAKNIGLAALQLGYDTINNLRRWWKGGITGVRCAKNIGLAALQLGYDTINNLRRWWKGEITGVRCAKNIVDSFFTVTGGVAGGIAGAAIGVLAGPVGAVVGSVVGGAASSFGMSMLSDRVTQWLFGIPKSEALENAYKYLGVSMTASNNEINSAFRQLCLKHHPDKPGGSTEDFLLLQLNMGTIKAAKGEL